jgi:hypothetical protein
MARGSAKLFDPFNIDSLRELLAKEDWGPLWLPLRDLVKLLGPSPDWAVVDARFRRAVLDSSLVDSHGTPPEKWRRCFDQMGDISWAFHPTVAMPYDLQEEDRFIYEPVFRAADWREVFRDLIPAAQPEPSSSTIDPDPFHTGAPGRPGARTWIEDKTKDMIDKGEVTPTHGGLSAFARETLHPWWEVERKKYTPARPAVTFKTIRNIARPIWNAALSARN